MFPAFDRVVIAVADLDAAATEYQRVLDFEPHRPDDNEVWFVLANITVVLRAATEHAGRVVGLVLAQGDAGPEPEPLENERDLALFLCDGSRTGEVRQQRSAARSVDHLVLRTADAEACIALFRDQLGMRLALDQTVPEWGGRMLFFRSGKLTLEVIEAADKKPGRDYIWGIAYRVENLEDEASRLAAAGLELSELRPGRKSGTRVATLKSCDQGVPTLLIEQLVEET